MQKNREHKKPARMEVQLPVNEKEQVVREAEKLGQSVTTYVRRSLQESISNNNSSDK